MSPWRPTAAAAVALTALVGSLDCGAAEPALEQRVEIAAAAPPRDATCDPLRTGEAAGCESSPIVQTRNGPVIGFLHSAHVFARTKVATFWGIPFADPPVGDNRLRAPQPLERTWTDPLRATRRSSICLQWADGADKLALAASEDCLYLNIYTPTKALQRGRDAPLLPVMVWIYGGAYVEGDAYMTVLGTSAYDGSPLAGRHDVVVVTLNYRLNGLGFFANDALREEDPESSTGNMALRDQRAALQWVQDNIAAFGGDPGRVTLFGESAGAFSVVWHLVSPPSWPLFQRAIVESGTSRLSWFFQPYKGYAQEMYAQWAAKIGCPGSLPAAQQLACLRGLDARLLLRPPPNLTVASPVYDPKGLARSFPVGPVIDGTLVGLSGVPLDLVKRGSFHRVPLIIGACKDGGTIFEAQVTTIVPGMHAIEARSRDDVMLALNWSFGVNDIPSIAATYEDEEFRTSPGGRVNYAAMFARIIRDTSFQCSDRALASAWAAQGAPVWLYTFSVNLGPLDKILGVGDFHSSDILFVFRQFLWLPEIVAFGGAYEMANIISCKWATFAHAASPDGDGPASWPPHCADVHPRYSAWPQYDATSRQFYSLKVPPKAVALRNDNAWPDDEFPSDRRCDMWDRVSFPWPSHAGSRPVDAEAEAEEAHQLLV